jgi:O-antigen/teichoic acid export membrane protein
MPGADETAAATPFGVKDPKQRLIKNIFSNWAGMAVGLVIAFFLSPFLVHNLGKSEYGIWALIFSIIYYTNLIDIGMKQSLARYLPRYYAVRDFVRLNEVINSGTFLYMIAGSLVILVTLVIAFFFLHYFQIEAGLLSAMQLTLIIIGLDQAITFFFMPSTAIGPFHRYDVNNIIYIPTAIVNALVIVYFLSKGYGLVTLGIITIATTVVRTSIRRGYQQALVPEIRFHPRFVKKDRCRELLGYGIISFFIVISWMVVFNTDNIIIGLFLSTTAVTYYSIAGTLVSHLRGLINAIGVPLVPAVSHYDAQNDNEQVYRLYSRVSRYLFYFTAGICSMLLISGDDFIYLWMGPDFTSTVHVLYILVVPSVLYLPQIAANSVMLGIGKHRTLFYLLISEAILNLILSLVLVRYLGIYGVALGTAITQLAIYSYIFPRAFHRVIGADLKSFYGYAAKSVFAGAAAAAPIGLLMDRYDPLTGWVGLAVDMAIPGIILLACFWWILLYPEDREKIKGKLRKRTRGGNEIRS